MKKVTVLLMCLILIFGLTACGNRQQEDNKAESSSETDNEVNSEQEDSETDSEVSSGQEDSEAETTEPTAPEEPAETEAADTQDKKTLVVYYSATGNTEEAADYIAAATDGVLFQLEPAEPYSDADLNWGDDSSRVVQEHENPDDRNVELVAAEVSDWESYDTVFVGYPIWWGEAPHIIYTLVENVSLRGKTVVPFSTSISSGQGSSGKNLKTKAKISSKTKWLNGRGFYGVPSQKTINNWINKLKY